ncbi:MAG: arylsulfatase [Planctomycetota bacterium]|nr:arylsulfatase [Planctomycetota bacterium]MDA1211781.1 arylsulfatase [Planctomycetota bacterium]
MAVILSVMAAIFFLSDDRQDVAAQDQDSVETVPAQDQNQPPPPSRKPNLIFILADDLGYGDLGCYGQKTILTPNLDKMAESGMRFTDHYAGCTVCAPSRCTLLTGMHTGHTLVRGNSGALLDPQDITLGKVMKAAGYRTAVFGKWGAGDNPPPGHPELCGFEDFYGYLDNGHAHNHFPDFLWKNSTQSPIRGNVVKSIGRGGVAIKKTQYSHDLLTAEALSYIEKNQSTPFFLYLSYIIPHANNEAGIEGMEVPDDMPYSDKPWPQPQKNHAAMITRLDRSIGEILAVLKKLELDDDTLVLFSSDNGPHKEGGADPAFFQSSGHFRGYKRDMYEGGIRVPLIAQWTGKVAENTTTNHVCALWDLVPTACSLAGVAPPEGIDGISYMPTLLGQHEQQKEHEYLYWEFHEGGSQQAIRSGKWKLIRTIGGPVELYDLEADPSEQTDLSQQKPDVVEKLLGSVNAARSESTIYPLKPKVPKPNDRVEESQREIRRRNRLRIRRTGKIRRMDSSNICRGGHDRTYVMRNLNLSTDFRRSESNFCRDFSEMMDDRGPMDRSLNSTGDVTFDCSIRYRTLCCVAAR